MGKVKMLAKGFVSVKRFPQ